MADTHLTDSQRCKIYELKVRGLGVRAVAEQVGRDKSTISRELRRNRGDRGYRPAQAARMASERLHRPRGGRPVAASTWKAVKAMLVLQSSPEQSAGRCKQQGFGSISHETIYTQIYDDKATGPTLHRHLRCNKKRRKRYGSGRTRRGRIPNRVGIEKRCPRVADRATVGHWEADLVIGKNHKRALVTLVERKSGYGMIRKVTCKRADLVASAIIEALRPISALVKSITFDNGLEFAKYEDVAKALNARIYFADPYSPWQRGTNENWNGLIRQYFPKGCRLDSVTDKQVIQAATLLHSRPRKRLAFFTPLEIFGPLQTDAVLPLQFETAHEV